MIYKQIEIHDRIVPILSQMFTDNSINKIEKQKSLDNFELSVQEKKKELETKYVGDQYFFFESVINYLEIDKGYRLSQRIGVVERKDE